MIIKYLIVTIGLLFYLELDLVRSFRFSKETSKETNTKCVICMSEYANREKLRRLPCSHDFHAKCIDKWLKVRMLCTVETA